MNRLAIQDRAPGCPPSANRQFDEIHRDWPVMGPEHEGFSFSQENRRVVCIAQPRGALDEGVQYLLQIERRAADDLEHVGGGGLLLQRFAQIVGALSQLVEEPRVLDGDDGLVGEAPDQLYLLVGEWADLLAVDNNSARQLGFLQHRDAKHGSGSGQLGDLRAREARRRIGVMRFVLDIGDLNRLFRRHRTPEGSSGAGTNYRVAPALFGIERRRAMQRNRAKRFSFGLKQHAELRLADAHCVLQHGVEHGSQLAWRGRNDAQHVGGGGLLLQRLLQLVEQPRILDGDDGLGGEICHQLNLLVREGTSFLTIDGDGSNQFIVFEHRHTDVGPNATKFDRGDGWGIAFEITLSPGEVGALDRLLRCNTRLKAGTPARMDQTAPAFLSKRLWHVVRRNGAKAVAFIEIKDAKLGLTKLRRVRQHRCEYRLQLAGRAGDDAQHLGGCGLLVPRLGKLARTRLKLLLELACVRLELLFRRSLRFLRPAELTHAGRPKLRIRRSEHSTPGRLLCETGHSAGP